MHRLIAVSPGPHRGRDARPRAIFLAGVLMLSCLSGGAWRRQPVNSAGETSGAGAPTVSTGGGATRRPFLTTTPQRLDAGAARAPRDKFPSIHAVGTSGLIASGPPAYSTDPASGGTPPLVYSRLGVARPTDRGPPPF